MPDKRDMHQAKSHRNSRNSKHQSSPPADRGARRPPAASPGAPIATFTEPELSDPLAPPAGKKNKNRR